MTAPVDDLSLYMTPREFAAMSSDAHHAVWKAHSEGRIDAVPSLPGGQGCALLYRREQVRTLLRELEIP